MALLPKHICSGQRCSVKCLALVLYVVVLVTTAAVLVWKGLYLYFVPAIASVTPLFFAVACRSRCASAAVRTVSDSVSSEIQPKIVDVFHPVEINHHPAPVHLIKRPGDPCVSVESWRPYTHTELLTATNNFDQSNLLGRGGEADVFRGVDQIFDEGDGKVSYGRDIAVKRFYFVSNDAEELYRANLQLLREVGLLRSANHRNVVKFYGYCIHGRERLLVSELMPNGSLHDTLFPRRARGPRESPLDWGQRLTIAKDAALGLDYLHNYCNANLVHLDIKPQNILLDDMLHAKIADFGLSRLIGRDHAFLTGWSMVGGTPGYRAPELSGLFKGREGNITKKADVYSFGIVLLQLASGRTVNSLPTLDSAAPISGMPGQTFRDAAFHLVKTQQAQSLIDVSLDKAAGNSKVGQRLLEIGAMCVEIDPMDRPDISQVNELLNSIST